ncbi:MAG: hypothetical protein CMP11_00655 [Zetaproteobacteria bacterium]|nr:hypothetical protein [Pseudobdellovibrionaceae bacterium]|tara:strand:- start:830 stop:1735 length:906 start_codon:yes stop_codon:yes gene_type:complete
MKTLSRIMIAVSTTFSFFSVAADFTQADDLFQRRHEGFEVATQARSIYEQKLSENISEDERVFAVSQIARLDIYRGGVVGGVKVEVRKKVFEKCLKTVSSIKKTNRQEYHYFTLSCLGFRGKLSESVAGRLKWAMKMRSAQGPALEATKSEGNYVGGFEGGGILRIMSAVRGNRKAKPVGLYDPKEALVFAERAIQAQARIYRPFPDPLSGEDFHENAYYVAQAKIAIAIEKENFNKVESAKQELESRIETLNELEDLGELPRGREPETIYYKGLMTELLGKVNKCINKDNWKNCLIDQLD